MHTSLLRRRALLTLAAAGLLSACATPPGGGSTAADAQPPIVFVHGNGDTAALWTTTLWRWESNGWPRAKLHAVDFPYPSARDDNTKEQAGRSSADDQMRHLAAEVDKVLAATGAVKVVLMGNSRGGNAIRHYIANGGGAAKVSHAILGGTPNHGVWSNPGFRPNNEFNGAGPFLTALNAPKGPNGDEVTPGVQWMTIRSDNNDKFAQPDGVWIGAKGTPTNVSFDGPALKGASNVVLPGRDHREVSYHPEAFCGSLPLRHRPGAGHHQPAAHHARGHHQPVRQGERLHRRRPDKPAAARRAAAGVRHRCCHRRAPRRRAGRPDHRRRWPLGPRCAPTAARRWNSCSRHRARPSATPTARPSCARRTSCTCGPSGRSPMPTRTPRPSPPSAGHAPTSALPRDVVLLNGETAPGIPPGVAGVATAKRKFTAAGQAVTGEFRSGIVSERITGRTWPAVERRVTVLELHE